MTLSSKEDVMHDLKNIIVDLISPWLDKLLHFVSVNARIIENEIYNIIKKFLEMVFYEKKFILIKQQYATLYKQLYEASNDMFDGFKSEETSVETNCNEEDSVVFDSLINVRKAFSLFINIISCIKSQKEEVIIEDVENSILLLSEKIIPLVSCSKKYPKLKPTIDALILSHLKSYYNLLPVLKEIYIVLGSQKPEYLKKTAVFLTNQLHKLYYITDMDDALAFAEYTFSIIDVMHTLLMQFINQIEDWHSYSTNSNGFDNSLAMANSMESNTAIPPVGEKELSIISSFLGLDQNQISISTTCLNSSDPASFRNNLSYIIEAILYSFTPRTELSLSLDFLLFSLNS
ncbi:MAG: hypothetical protein MHPSP_002970, partial [Paramarteilia canceri]